ncbi:MAG: S9 family peptidase [Chitinophagaceae bacterium]|nr:MAG: S9 family peptidase [Chitinophagaceae bacterium]
MKKLLWLLLLLPLQPAISQTLAPLTVEKIMRDPKWIGSSPSNVFWSPDSKKVYFNWNPDQALAENESIYVGGGEGASPSDSLYYITLSDHDPRKVPPANRALAESERFGSWNDSRTQMVFTKDNMLYLLEIKSGNLIPLIQTTDRISNPEFGFHNTQIIYHQNNNLYAVDLTTGRIQQLTDFENGKKPVEEKPQLSPQEQFLQDDALENSRVLRQRKVEKEAAEKALKDMPKPEAPKTIYTGNERVTGLTVSPDGNYIFYSLMKIPEGIRNTIVPEYVTQSGYTETMPGRPVAGIPQVTFKSYIYDRKRDSVYQISTEQIPGIKDIPAFVKYYPHRDSMLMKDPPIRQVSISHPVWNEKGSHAFVVVSSRDHKDRWIMLLDPSNGKLKLLDRQHNDAWVGWGPGIGSAFGGFDMGNAGWLNENTVWYQSEVTGYSHLYTVNVETDEKTTLTSGKYEVQQAQLSADRKTFYILTNEIEPGQTQFYQLDIKTRKQTRITTMTGGNQVTVSPDGKNIAFLFSTVVHPWELYLQQNKSGTKADKVTGRAESALYKSYPWRTPEIFTFKDGDNDEVYAEVYKPEKPAATHPGVIFVHGAGYLQDVDRWWSYYFREHMFMNLLCDQGYTVMDIDYRGSAGYGSAWRTAIYRHMGGKDLDDEVDGAKYMVKAFGVNPKYIGIWGGSYGGFMTLSAMFKSDEFACGAALRSVTDWAHYNDGYTSAILNDPQEDSLAYQQSSPIYFANGLQKPLLMCHGMVDTNVHFQDIVRLTQKLIEMGKKNWWLAAYPVESHDFKEPSSWTDEYTRIYNLFQTYLK